MKHLLLLVVVALALPLFASNPVSDATALELIFLTSCTVPGVTPANELVARGNSLHKYRLSDEPGMFGLLTSHCARYYAAIKQHNATMQYDSGDDSLWRITVLAPLVWDTADKIKAKYPAEWDGFMAKVQDEKERMTVPDETPMMAGLQDNGIPHIHNPAPKMNAQTTFDNFPNTYGYTGYINWITDGASLWISAAMVGSSPNAYCTWEPYHQMWQPTGVGCPAVVHTPSIDITMSGGAPQPETVHYVNTGTALAPNQYMSQSWLVSPTGWNFWVKNTPRPKITLTGAIRLLCSVARAYIVSWPINYKLTDTYTKGHIIPGCQAYNHCTPETTPPAANWVRLNPLTAGACNHPYWDGFFVWVSYAGTAWQPTGMGTALSLPDTDSVLGVCQKYSELPAIP